MWINHETLRRASRSNRTGPRPGIVILGVLLAIVVLLGACDAVEEQTAAPDAPLPDSPLPSPPPAPPEAAILLSGPVPGRGLPFLPPNVVGFSYALYEIDENRLEVYYTSDAVFGTDGWEALDCQAFVLRRNVSEEVFHFESPEGWSLFVGSEAFLDDPCGVFGGLIERITFFSRSLGEGQSPLPAVFLTRQ